MIIIGLTGGIGHGKSTFASYIEACSPVHAHLEASDVISEVANDLLLHAGGQLPINQDLDAINTFLAPLPAIILSRTNATAKASSIQITETVVRDSPEYIDKLFTYLENVKSQPNLGLPLITAETKDQYRPLLQWLGGYLVHTVSEGIWFDELCWRAQAQPPDALVTISGIRYPSDAKRVKNIGGVIVEIYRPELDAVDALDITERERSNIHPDIRVISNKGLVELERCATAVYNSIAGNEPLRSMYTTSEY
jgi:hypothetical protein